MSGAEDQHESREKRQQQDEEDQEDGGSLSNKPDEAEQLKVVPCNKHVHSSCLMERSKWKACITGQNVRGFCRTHEAQHKLVMPVKNSAL